MTKMEGLRIINGQLNAVIQDQKCEINNLQDLLQNEQKQCRLLTNQIKEANEKLFVSDSTISELQMQIRELNQTESLSRAHHETILAYMREKYKEEVLSLKEKVGDLQQSLAWKSEDLNKLKELLKSNSSGREIGMLRNCLSNKEKKVTSLEKDLALLTKHSTALEEQLKMFKVALKTDSTFGNISSMPRNVATAHMGRDQVEYKSPIARDINRLNIKSNDDSNVQNKSSKVKWLKEHNTDKDILIQNSVLSSKVEFLNDFENQLAIETNQAVGVTRNERLMNHIETDSSIKQLNDEWNSEQQMSSHHRCIFSANAEQLKITSATITPFLLDKGGICKLLQEKNNQSMFVYSIEDYTNEKKCRKCNFKVEHDFKPIVKHRDCQFTIVLNGESKTQVIGKFCNVSDCVKLVEIFENIKNISNLNNILLSSKENISSVYSSPNSVYCSTSILSSSKNRTPLTPLGMSKVTPSNTSIRDHTPSKSICKQRLFPSFSNERDNDDFFSATAIGGKKASSFYKINDLQENKNLQTSKLLHSKKLFRFRNKQSLSNHISESKTALIGFSNLGNTCYMNSILQCLLNIPNFFQDMNDPGNINIVPTKSLYHSLYNLGVLKYSLDTLENQIFALKQVKSVISEAAVRFSGCAQNEAHEFLCQCLDQLKEDLLNNKDDSHLIDHNSSSDSDESSREKCPIKQNFESKIMHTVVCKNCDEKVFKTEVCHDFSLVIPDFDENSDPSEQNLNQLIQMYFSDEVVEYSCEKCKSPTSVLSHQFKKLPRVLIFHIKRYDISESKRCDRVVLPKLIDMKFLATSNTALPKEYIFDKTKLWIKKPLLKNSSTEKRKTCETLDCEPLNKTSKMSLFPENDLKKESFMSSSKTKENTNDTFTKLRNIDSKNDNGVFSPYSKYNTNSNNGSIGTYTDLDKKFEEFTTVSDDEEEDLKKALELSMKDFNNKQHDDDLRYESLFKCDYVSDINPLSPSMKGLNEETVSLKYSYNLVGVVNHHGAHTSTGHYTSDIYDFKSDCWKNYNDSTVKDIKVHEVCYGRSQSACIVFYLYNACYQSIKNNFI
nr:ubiquitin carboxyl-terminal hydrolase 37 isoform X2 [Hydra vulgaris]